MICALAILYPITAYFLQSKCVFYLLMLISEIVVLVYTFLCAILMFIVMLMGDLCMDPSSVASGNSMLYYYTSCSGTSPFGDSITSIKDQIKVLTDNQGNCFTSGSANDLLAAAQATIVGDQFTNVNTAVSCNPTNGLNMVWNDAVNQGICTNFMNGLFKIWVSQYVVSGALFFTIICASVLYQYFGVAWKLKATGEMPDEDGKDLENPSAQAPEYELTHAEYDGGDFVDSHVPPPPPQP